MSQAIEILKSYSLRRTASRSDILSLFIAKGVALSEPEIEKEMHGRCDRVTIYRTLSTFMDKGLLHKVLDDAGAAKYALCASNCAEETYHTHNHVHFKCSVCGRTICLDDIQIPAINLPQGYDIEEMNMLLQGICSDCKSAENT